MQEVNLLSEALQPQRIPLSLKDFSIALGVLTLVLCTITSWQVSIAWNTSAALKVQKDQLVAAGQQLKNLEAKTNIQADPVLVQRLGALTKEREEQRRLVNLLEEEPMNDGFQYHLRDLASIDMRNLWFDSIALTHGGRQIHLSGFSRTAEQVPLFLSMLSEGIGFSGYRFDGLEIKRKTNILVTFEVHGPMSSKSL